MIIVRVELWSAITGQVTELARMQVDNIGTNESGSLRDYHVATMRGRDADTLHRSMVNKTYTHEAQVLKHPAPAQHVWVLIAKALTALGYAKR